MNLDHTTIEAHMLALKIAHERTPNCPDLDRVLRAKTEILSGFRPIQVQELQPEKQPVDTHRSS